MKITLKTLKNVFFIFTLMVLFIFYSYGEANFSLEKLKQIFYSHENKLLFCIILTTPSNFQTRTRIVDKTWAQDCDKYFFVTKMNNTLSSNQSHEYTNPYKILQPLGHNIEVYDKLTDKVYATFRDLYLRYNDYQWYLKADDDTFVFVENLKDFLKSKNSSLPVTYGFKMNMFIDHGYHSGGAGYVLSNDALSRFGQQLVKNECTSTGVEDVDVANCLRKVNVLPDKSTDEHNRQRFHPFNVTMHFNGNYPDWFIKHTDNPKSGTESWSENSISFHYMSPGQIEKLHSLWEHLKKTSVKPYNLSSILYKMVNYN